jgi:hypothetical protein
MQSPERRVLNRRQDISNVQNVIVSEDVMCFLRDTEKPIDLS